MSDSRLHVLLVRRGVAPFAGKWAIPGGFKRPTETLDEAAKRELSEETGVDSASLLKQFGAYGDPGRDPRMNVVTIAYLAVLRDVGAVVAGTDAASAALVPVSEVLNGKMEPGFRSRAEVLRDASGARSRRPRPDGHRNGVRRTDLHPGRAEGGVRGRLGRASRWRELPEERRHGGRLGDPDRTPSSARRARRQARRALSSGSDVEVQQSDPEPPAKLRRRKGTHESCSRRQIRAAGRSATRRRRDAHPQSGRGPHQDSRHDGHPDGLRHS